MSKIGVELKIDVTKIDKARLYQGEKGKYLTMTVFVDPDNTDSYGNNGMITHKLEQGEAKGSSPILGNCKVFWQEEAVVGQGQPAQQPNQQSPQQQSGGGFDDFDDSIPF